MDEVEFNRSWLEEGDAGGVWLDIIHRSIRQGDVGEEMAEIQDRLDAGNCYRSRLVRNVQSVFPTEYSSTYIGRFSSDVLLWFFSDSFLNSDTGFRSWFLSFHLQE